MNRASSTSSSLAYQALPAQGESKGTYRYFAILCVIALLTASLHENVQVHLTSHDPNFNFFLFSQMTTVGYCAGNNHCVRSQIRPYFTIHGLWPSNDTSWPENCNLTAKFNITMLDPIRSDLDKYWPSALGVNPEYFWHHEWQKHGSCAMNVPELSGVLKFFNGTLKLLRAYNVSNFLLDDNITPSISEPYTVKQLLLALKDDLSTKANIVCRKVDGYAFPVLSEIRFCLSKTTLAPIDCKLKHENCGTDRVFYLPSDVHYNPHAEGLSQVITGSLLFYLKYLSPV